MLFSAVPVPGRRGDGGGGRRRRGRLEPRPGPRLRPGAAAARGPAERAHHQRAEPGAPGARPLQVRRGPGAAAPRAGRPHRRRRRRLPRRGRHHWVPATQRLFGGQIVGQALVAAARAVSRDEQVHSLHCYFVRAGTAAGSGPAAGSGSRPGWPPLPGPERRLGPRCRGLRRGRSRQRLPRPMPAAGRRRHPPAPAARGRGGGEGVAPWCVLLQRRDIPFLCQGTPRCRCCTRWSGPTRGRASLFAL